MASSVMEFLKAATPAQEPPVLPVIPIVPVVAQEEPRGFPSLLRYYRERIGRSRNALALKCSVDPSYILRCENGSRNPPTVHIVEAIARELRLKPFEIDRLLVAAGYAPQSVASLGYWDDALKAVIEVLNDHHLDEADRAEFSTVVTMLAGKWRGK